MSQTIYNLRPDFALPGQRGNSVDSDVRTGINASGGAYPFGVAVAKKTGDPAGTLFGTTKTQALALVTDKVEGLVMFSDARDNIGLGTSGGAAIKTGDTFNLMTRGDMWVSIDQDVSSDDPVFVRFAASANQNLSQQPGTFRKDGDAGTARRLLGARWVQPGTAAAGVAMLTFNQMVEAAAAGDSVVAYDQAIAAATASIKIFEAPSARFYVIDEVDYNNPTGFAADPNNYWSVALQDAAVVMAAWSTQTGAQGALGADTPVNLVLQAAANRILKPGDVMSLVLTKTGAPANLPAGRLVIHGHYIY